MAEIGDASAAAVFRALCPTCGYVEVPAERFRLVLVARPFYSYSCPGCEQVVRRPAGPRIVELLTAAGVPAIRVHAS